MTIKYLKMEGVRNLLPARLAPCPHINLITGSNGSGKTSLLEAIHLLGVGRSFRASAHKPVINHALEKYTVFGEIDHPSTTLGVSRSKGGEVVMRLGGAPARATAELAHTLPLQLLNQDGFALLEGAPKQRRQFIDWGVFHVEQGFWVEWKRAQRALKQRNHGLRHGMIRGGQLAAWDAEFIAAAERIDTLRMAYVEQLAGVFSAVLARWQQAHPVQLAYYRGWDKARTLAQVLEQDQSRDAEAGFTQHGPHRADLRIRHQGLPAVEVLSRGQQKVVVSALRIAQGKLLASLTGRRCVYLVDDLASELDETNREVLCDLLVEMDAQVFVTCIEKPQLYKYWAKAPSLKVFHVEQGCITEAEANK